MAYAPMVRRGPYAPLSVPPSRRILARTRGPASYEPQLEGFFDVLLAPFKYGAKAISTVGKGAYQAGRFVVRKAPTAAVGFATGGPAGAALAVGASVARDLAKGGGGQPGTAGAFPVEYPPEVGYGAGTVPPYSTGAQGYGRRATVGMRGGATPVLLPGAVVPAVPRAQFALAAPKGGDLLKWAPLAVGALMLLKKS